MPEDFFALFGTPQLIRRYAALHARSAEIFLKLAEATERHDLSTRQECMTALAALAVEQTEGRGHVDPPTA